MEKQYAEQLIEESLVQIRMRQGLKEMGLKKISPEAVAGEELEDELRAKCLDLLLPLNIEREPLGDYPILKTGWNKQDYERRKMISTLFLRGIIFNKLVKYEQNPRIGKLERIGRGLLAFNYHHFNQGLFSTTWEYDILVRTNKQIANILNRVAPEHKHSLIFGLNIDDPFAKGSSHRRRYPLLAVPGATPEELEIIIQAETKRKENRGYLDYGY